LRARQRPKTAPRGLQTVIVRSQGVCGCPETPRWERCGFVGIRARLDSIFIGEQGPGSATAGRLSGVHLNRTCITNIVLCDFWININDANAPQCPDAGGGPIIGLPAPC
jgi:hypothetical protein